MIKIGDLVIKNTGGNKMKVISIKNGIAECVWLTESFNQDNFRVNDLVPISQYATIFKNYQREEIIDKLLKQINFLGFFNIYHMILDQF